MSAVDRKSGVPAVVGGLLCMLAGCGGIEGTGSPQAGIEGTGLVEGVLTTAGSVSVNGTEYSTDGADIVVDGEPANTTDLQTGMVVSMVGETTDDGQRSSASQVEFDRQLFGPIDFIDRDMPVVSILGQSVYLDDATQYGEGGEDGLREGRLCLMSGYPAGDGEFLASLLQCSDGYIAGQTAVEVEGLVHELDSDTGLFRLGELEVSIGNAVLDVSQGTLVNDALVEVIGRQPQRGGVLNAERIRVKKTIQSSE